MENDHKIKHWASRLGKLATLTRSFVWQVASRLGARAKKWVWDDQFNRGRWDYLVRDNKSFLVALVAKYSHGGRIIELGCGEGRLAEQLPEGTYSSYLGIDISRVAIDRAIVRCRALKRVSFEMRSIEEWRGSERISVIILEESLYYLRPKIQKRTLETCLRSLCLAGVVILVVHDAKKHAVTLDIARRSAVVIAEICHSSRTYLLLTTKERRDNPGPVGPYPRVELESAQFDAKSE